MPEATLNRLSVVAAEKGRHGLIRSINPRLAAYNRPALLALLILLATLAASAVTFVVMIRGCRTSTSTELSSAFGITAEHKLLITDGIRSMDGWDAESQAMNTVTVCLMNSREMNTFAHPNFPRTAQSPSVVGYVPCFASRSVLSEIGITWCSQPKDFEADAQKECTRANNIQSGACRACGDAVGNGVTKVPNAVELPYTLLLRKEVKRRVCPNALETFGITLGYATYFELIATVIVIVALSKLGYVHVTDGSSITGTTIMDTVGHSA